ncbi:hypothetical protein J5N97_009955 [Dioscorea zingiberensis]|uniref:Uncharacterized protein n=1 Tax=Dioscorea zingiberensis TaxID=325984 RepID=A0A9D5D0G9_9LILI|nr:hypothetical protein J5N97_009955 [Dioscorea zingiberensis]
MEQAPLLPRRKLGRYVPYTSQSNDELCNFRLCLKWVCVDKGGGLTSWALFLLLAVIVPIISHFVLSYAPTRRAFDSVVELSLTGAAALSYYTLGRFLRLYGLHRFLALDKVHSESDRIRLGYTTQLNRSFRLLSYLVMPCFCLETVYRIWWYSTGVARVPFVGNAIAIDAAACALELASWMYRTGLLFLVCVLFRLTCYLQILRLQDFATVFEEESDVELVLREHLRIRRQLKIISHRFRSFIVCFLALVTASQFAALFLTTRPHAAVNFFNAGELAIMLISLAKNYSKTFVDWYLEKLRVNLRRSVYSCMLYQLYICCTIHLLAIIFHFLLMPHRYLVCIVMLVKNMLNLASIGLFLMAWVEVYTDKVVIASKKMIMNLDTKEGTISVDDQSDVVEESRFSDHQQNVDDDDDINNEWIHLIRSRMNGFS